VIEDLPIPSGIGSPGNYEERTMLQAWVGFESVDKQADPSRRSARKSVPSVGGQAAAPADGAPEVRLPLQRLLIWLLRGWRTCRSLSLSLLRGGGINVLLG
jgi:hypothetical protein